LTDLVVVMVRFGVWWLWIHI